MGSAHFIWRRDELLFYFQQVNTRVKKPIFLLKDLATLLLFIVFIPVCAFLNRKSLQRLSVWLVSLASMVFKRPELESKIKNSLSLVNSEQVQIARQSVAERLASFLYFLRGLVRKDYLNVSISNIDVLTAELNKDRGVILWVAAMTHLPDACKIALHQKGFLVSHLSRPEHGFSSSRFGIKFLNPIRTRYECRFLKQRVVIEDGNTKSAVAHLETLLGNNEIISILASAHQGKALFHSPFLNHDLQIAVGAPSIAYNTGAALLPVFGHTKNAETEEFEIRFGEPIDLSGEDKREAVQGATLSFLRSLEDEIRSHPNLSLLWQFLTEPSAKTQAS